MVSVQTNALKAWFDQQAARAEMHGLQLSILIEGESYRFVRVEVVRRQAVRVVYSKGGLWSTVIERWPRASGSGFVVHDEDDEVVEIQFDTPRVRRMRVVAPDSVTDEASGYVGQRFGLLVVRALLGWRGRSRLALCDCDCGGVKEGRISSLLKGDLISCGCRRGKNRELPLQPGECYGRLTVIEQVPRPDGETRNGGYYRVRCDCGSEVIRRRERIVSPGVADCGCRGVSEVTGQRFGMVVVTGQTRRTQRHREYHVRCDCGGEAWLRINDMRIGKAKSCGCLRGRPGGKLQ